MILAALALLVPVAVWIALVLAVSFVALVAAALVEAVMLRRTTVTLERKPRIALPLDEADIAAIRVATTASRPLRLIIRQRWPQIVTPRSQSIHAICRPGEVLQVDLTLRGIARGMATVEPANAALTMFGLAELVNFDPRRGIGVGAGNVARTNRPSGPDGAVRPCVECGLYLVVEGDWRTAILFRSANPQSGSAATAQIVSTEPGHAQRVAAELRVLVLEHNVFRGQVLSFGGEVFGHGQAMLSFHRRPDTTAAQLILGPDVLAQIERQVVVVARHRDQLRAAGQHLKRGLLLYGPPGVGKTHTVRYLTASLPHTTVIELTGSALHMLGEACSIARSLAPAMIVVEDVDLIAENRGMHPGQHPMLFQLLNEMDGLAEDSDVLFVLTTNRADLLEPALAERPGRIDQAVELTPPDRLAREQLFGLYKGRLDVDTSRLDDVLDRTDGVTASFIKELLRRAALLSAVDSAETKAALRVTADQLDAALTELLDTKNAMTRILLGGATEQTRP